MNRFDTEPFDTQPLDEDQLDLAAERLELMDEQLKKDHSDDPRT